MWRVLKNKRGYTLVELLVVMGIMAVLSVLSYSGYVIFKQQMYVKHVGNQLQTDIRDSFIRSIAVKDDGTDLGGDCVGKVAKLRVIKIPLTDDFKGYQMVSYCEGTDIDGGPVLLKKSSATVNPTDSAGYRAKVISTAMLGTNVLNDATSFLCLAYASPYGEFGDYWSTEPLTEDTATDDKCDIGIKKWIKKKDGSYPPPDPLPAGSPSELVSLYRALDLTVNFSLESNPSVSQQIIIHPSGGADLKNL